MVHPAKKVLLLLVDSLSARILSSALAAGEFPNLQRLRQAGVWREMVSIFPSITHAALSTIATGRYPRTHGVLGSYWYLAASDEIAYYGADPNVIWTTGIGNFYEDFVLRLNHDRLKSKTVFQHVEAQGLQAGSLNYLMFHGDQRHEVDPPLLMRLVPTINQANSTAVSGPSTLFLGDFVQATAVSPLPYRGGPENWFGFKDASTGDALLALAKAKSLPDLTVAYFPECDVVGHEIGPEDAHHQVLPAFDDMLGELMTHFGGLEAMLAEVAILITGDHAQCPIAQTDAEISLTQILSMFQVAPAGKTWRPDDDLMVCTNLRAATLYFREPTAEGVQTAVDALRPSPGIDHIIFPARWLAPDQEGIVIQKDAQQLRFWPGGSVADAYGNTWSWEGELAVVDGQVDGNTLRFDTYPNAFERIAGVVDSADSGQVWLSASPEHEFSIPGVRIHHGGGSHGSLHKLDSLSPLIAAGLPTAVDLPARPRLVDIMPLCLAILDTKRGVQS